MKYAKFGIALFITIGLYRMLSLPMGKLPALGYILDPYEGFLQQSETRPPDKTIPLAVQGLKQPVEVYFDSLMVPHIVAQNDEDAYFMQGYLTAYFRLWQMDMVTRAAGGRLSEVVGEIALKRDRYMRRLGMLKGAQNAVQAMQNDTVASLIMNAYTKGINAYIQNLSYAQYPIEFKLLGYKPEPWTPLKTALLLKYMAYDLAGKSSDKELTDIRKWLGNTAVQELFPDYSPFMEPIHPQNPEWKNYMPSLPLVPSKDWAEENTPFLSSEYSFFAPEKSLGSNNFVISGSRSQSGYPILANDPHLRLTFPSIWFQIQLQTPTMNVCGVSLPGAPGVIIGFNEHIAWGVTNVAPDIMDYYKITYKDASKKEYLYESEYKPIQFQIDTIYVKGKGMVLDTVRYTHHGPIVDDKNEGFDGECPADHALRWLAHDPSKELLTFYYLNRAKNLQDYRYALTHFSCPAQNFIFASNTQDIALTSNGKYPLKWKGQGKFALDGSRKDHEWQGWVPFEHNPYTVNPPQGYIASANQFPTDTTYPYYLHWEFATFERGKRIHERLQNLQNATYKDLQSIQLDSKNLLAEVALPVMLNLIDENQMTHPTWLRQLRKWNYLHEPSSVEASLFMEWWKQFYNLVWDEFVVYPTPKDTLYLRTPEGVQTAYLLRQDPENKWFDNKKTSSTETARDLLLQAWKKATQNLAKQFGSIDKAEWYLYRGTKVRHLANIEAFSSDWLYHGGGTDIVNALGKTAGPSWRMVVQLGPLPNAYGIYPAGQSGNPGSHYYDNQLPIWLKGELLPINFLTKNEKPNKNYQTKLVFSANQSK